MENNVKAKGILILIVATIALYYAFPTYQAYFSDYDPQTIENKVNLGLDLQGGMYLDIEVKVEEAEKAVLRRTAQEIEDLFLDNQVDYLIVDVVNENEVLIELPPEENVNLEVEPYERFLVQFNMKQDGNQYVLELKPEEVTRIHESAVSQGLEVLRNRIDGLGISEPSLQLQGENSILIQLPGLKEREKAIELIGPQAVLEFYLVSEQSTPKTYNRFSEIVRYQEILDATKQNIVQRVPYVLEKKPLLTGEYIRDARIGFDQTNQPYVSLSFDSIGADRFESITRRNRGRLLAIVLDDKVQSAPVIREAISGGEASISGQFTIDEAKDLAIILRSGSLPAPIEIREERTVGASLGEDSVRQGIQSLLIGGVIVLVFMLIYYRLAGMFANVALVMNLILIISILGVFGATLTLPGMAGIVLTVGMAVDANVLIFQRIREELKRTKHPRAAIQEGFNKAFRTILDANITTLIAALVLMQFGTGPIKGFAVTLSIGIMASMFTAIVVTRFFFDIVFLNRKQLKNVRI